MDPRRTPNIVPAAGRWLPGTGNAVKVERAVGVGGISAKRARWSSDSAYSVLRASGATVARLQGAELGLPEGVFGGRAPFACDVSESPSPPERRRLRIPLTCSSDFRWCTGPARGLGHGVRAGRLGSGGCRKAGSGRHQGAAVPRRQAGGEGDRRAGQAGQYRRALIPPLRWGTTRVRQTRWQTRVIS